VSHFASGSHLGNAGVQLAVVARVLHPSPLGRNVRFRLGLTLSLLVEHGDLLIADRATVILGGAEGDDSLVLFRGEIERPSIDRERYARIGGIGHR
jgi:hypothetical protein